MNAETEKLKLKVIETQLQLIDTQRALLQYQHRDISAGIEALEKMNSMPADIGAE